MHFSFHVWAKLPELYCLQQQVGEAQCDAQAFCAEEQYSVVPQHPFIKVWHSVEATWGIAVDKSEKLSFDLLVCKRLLTFVFFLVTLESQF